jgi:hypothetical protein
MSTFFEMADQDWRVIVDDCDITEPTIAYPDQRGRGRMVGPLVKLYVGVTVTDEDGDEALELDGEDGRNLAAVACLPQLASLCRWISKEIAKLGVSENDEYNVFVDELRNRVEWIRECIDEREPYMHPGEHGFDRYNGREARNP